MAFWFQDNHLLAPGQSVTIEYWFNGGADWGAQIATPVPYLAANEWLQVTGQGLFYDFSTRMFRYFATFTNTANETANFQIRGAGLT
jgi:hypothetical protein